MPSRYMAEPEPSRQRSQGAFFRRRFPPVSSPPNLSDGPTGYVNDLRGAMLTESSLSLENRVRRRQSQCWFSRMCRERSRPAFVGDIGLLLFRRIFKCPPDGAEVRLRYR